MLRCCLKLRRKKNTPVPTMAAKSIKSDTTHEPVNLARDKDHKPDQGIDTQGFKSIGSGYSSAAEVNMQDIGLRMEESTNALKDATHFPSSITDTGNHVSSSSAADKCGLVKNMPEQGHASSDRDEITVGVADSDPGVNNPVQSTKVAPSNVQMFHNASGFQITGGQFINAGRDVRVTQMNNDVLLRIVYATGAGIDTTKACLEGTRTEILDEIKDWVTDTDATAPRVLWLSGPAGTGKSAIAHSIARWWTEEIGGIGSCFCFNRQAPTRHERLFSTIAVDLAARIPALKDSLIKLITSEPALAATADVTQQWRKFLQGPLTNITRGIAEPFVIVIDALDESGEEPSRDHILSILANNASKLPSNFRILVTSRPLPDINDAFHDVSGIKYKSMDMISASSTEHDIQLYIQTKRIKDFDNQKISQLARKSDGLFEWARLACEYVKYAKGFSTERERFEELVTVGLGKGLLDNMYTLILRGIMGDYPHHSTLARFRSVLRTMLSALTPLPMDSLSTLHCAARKDHSCDDVPTVLDQLGSLLSGISDRSMPVRLLHSTFHEFLTSHERSGQFFVDMDDVNRDLAHACLQVMEQHLCFNICKLESSYVHNSEIVDLGERIKANVKPYLVYSCQYWTDHIKLVAFEAELAGKVKGILMNEKMLFWLEVCALLKLMNMVPAMLYIVVRWLQDKNGYDEVSAAARDGIRFARMSGGIISESTPHLYLSGLPFLPEHSVLSRLKSKFPGIPRIAFGGIMDWPPLELSMRGHTSGVRSVSFSHDGKRIVSGSHDKSIYIWDAETGLQVGSPLKGHTHWVNSVAFSPDRKRIVSGSDDKTIYIWDAGTGLQVGNALTGHTDWVKSVAFSPDGKRIVSGAYDKTIYIWDVKTGLQVGNALKGHTDGVNSVAFSPDGKRIVSGSKDKTICIWDAETGLQMGNPLKGHTHWVNSVAISPDGKRIASGSNDKTIYIWDAETGLQVGNPLKGHTSLVNSVDFSPDGKRIVSGSHDKTIYIWNAETGSQVGSPLKGHTSRINSVGFSPDGKRIVSGSLDKTIYIWDADSVLQVSNPLKGQTSGVKSVAISPDGKRIVSSSWEKTICIWDAETGLQVGKPLEGHTQWVNLVAFSPDGKKIVSGSHDATICIWDAETGLQVGNPLKGHTSRVNSVSFSPDGKRIVSGSSDKTIYIWDAETGLQVGNPLKGHTFLVNSVGFSPDGKRIVSGSRDETVCIWDVETGLQALGNPLKGHTSGVASVAFSPDGKKIVSGSSDKTVCIWDAETGLQVGNPLKGHTAGIKSVAFSPDGKRIVSAAYDKTIYIWDAKTRLQVGNPLRGHSSGVNSAVFSPDGKRIISGSDDATINIWDAESNPSFDSHSQMPPPVFTNRANVIKFSPTDAHALCQPSNLFYGTQELQQDWREHVDLHPNGWITGPQSHLLMWIPETKRVPFLLPKTHVHLIIPRQAIELDLSSMAHGHMWVNCYDG